MDRLTDDLNACFGSILAPVFISKAVYHHDLDFIEYIAKDSFVVSKRIDEYLTILKDGDNGELIGFKLKGFHLLYNEVVKPILTDEENEIQFVDIVPVLTYLIGKMGDTLIGDRRKEAYYKVAHFAKTKDIKIDRAELQKAA